MCFLSGLNGDNPLIVLYINIRNTSNKGYINTAIANTGFDIPINSVGKSALSYSISSKASMAIIKPIVNDPESPMKILAGEKLKNKKANNSKEIHQRVETQKGKNKQNGVIKNEHPKGT